MDAQETYVCDADSLITLRRHFKRKCITRLRRFAKSGLLRVPEGVARELRRKTDHLSNFVKRYEESIVVRMRDHPKLPGELVRIESSYGESIRVGNQTYRGFWASQAGRKAADGQVVATARVFGCTVVSDDHAVKLACALENVPCIGWAEFARRLGLMEQLPLFDLER